MPVHYDVWFRAMINILPMSSKYRFMEATNLEAATCPYARCQDVETPRHVLHDCTCVRVLWQAHRSAWQKVGVDLSWDMCMSIDLITPPEHLRNFTDTILWMHRNRVAHQDAVGPQIERMTFDSMVQWSGLVRAALRDTEQSLHSKVQILTVVALLSEDTKYSDAQANNNNIFSAFALPRKIRATSPTSSMPSSHRL
ncbi:hypothetical protein ACHHYP_06203 [Achlya hypogyna]|uniref:Reverse transcriptase zinc-binding domain-containing protein n=1 Tax=Achlya hypogyna TaxID=1202772 RepID=A0A1V9YUZ0_ACHHY|nr:hypothetical protein ACHHYP_06203 [Achlya hypogyna]